MSPDGPRNKPCKVDMTEALYNEVEKFLENDRQGNIHSRNELIEYALRYFIRDYKDCGKTLNTSGFPVGLGTLVGPPNAPPAEKENIFRKNG